MVTPEMIDKTVYTKNNDGTAEKWYLTHIFNDGCCAVRKSPKNKWIDVTLVFPITDVYATKREAIKALNPSVKLF